MQVVSLKLENFKKHESFETGFTPGSYTIVGPNYAGKTTICEGLLFGLFGASSLPPGVTVDDLVRTNARGFSVELQLSNGWTIHRTKSSSRITDADQKVLCTSHTAVNEKLVEQIGVGFKEFKRRQVSAQGEPQQLLTLSKSELNRFVESCTGVWDLDAILSLLKQRIVSKNGIKLALTDVVAGYPSKGEMEGLVNECEARYQESLERQNQWNQEIDPAKRSLKRLEEQIEAYNGYLKAKEDNQRQLSLIEAQLAQEGQNLAELSKDPEDEKATEKELVSVQAELASINTYLKEKETWQGLVSSLTAEVAETEKALAKQPKVTQEDLDQLNEKIGETSDKIEEAQNTLGGLKTTINHLETTVEKSYCPTCRRPFNEISQQEVEAFRNQLQEKKSSYASLEAEFTGLKAEKQKFAERYKDCFDAFRNIQALEGDLEGSQGRLNRLITEGEPQKPGNFDNLSSFAVLECELKDRLKAIKANNVLKQDIRSRRKKLSHQLEELRKFKPNPFLQSFDIEDAKARVTPLISKVTTLEIDLNAVADRLREGYSQMLEARESLKVQTEQREGLEEALHSLGVLERLRSKIVTNRRKLVQGAWDQVLQFSSELVRAMSGGDVQELGVTDQGVTFTERDGASKTIHLASGSQKSMIGLALKIATGQLSGSGLDCIFLDEPTADMRDELSSSVMTVIAQSHPQVIAITHRALDSAENIIDLSPD